MLFVLSKRCLDLVHLWFLTPILILLGKACWYSVSVAVAQDQYSSYYPHSLDVLTMCALTGAHMYTYIYIYICIIYIPNYFPDDYTYVYI